jgi:hypothetical protein
VKLAATNTSPTYIRLGNAYGCQAIRLVISSDWSVFANLRPNAAKFGLGIGAFIVWPLTLDAA